MEESNEDYYHDYENFFCNKLVLETVQKKDVHIQELCQFLFSDKEMYEQATNEVAKYLHNNNLKKTFINELNKNVTQVNIISLLRLFTIDELLELNFVNTMMYHDTCVTNKYCLLSSISSSEELQYDLKPLLEYIVKSASNVLKNKKSTKSEVKMAVRILKYIKKTFNNDSENYASEILIGDYDNNSLWQDLILEEKEYRERILTSSFGEKANHAFRNKDYTKVVEILEKYSSELPKVLQAKYKFSVQKISHK